MNNIEEKIKYTESERDKYERKVKFWRFIYKFVGFIHIGCSGTFAVNAMKELINGSFSGLSMFIGLLISFFVSTTILEKIVQYNQDKKTKLDIDLVVLDKDKKIYEQREQRRKTREQERNRVNKNYISNNNEYTISQEHEMKLSLRGK